MTVDRSDPVGLCRSCVHARPVTTPRSTFWRCGLSDSDPRFPRYPRLPVLACAGYEERTGDSPAVSPGDA